MIRLRRLSDLCVMAAGPAKGHGIVLTARHVGQVLGIAARLGRVHLVFGHTDASVGEELGYLDNFRAGETRRDGESVPCVLADATMILTPLNSDKIHHVLRLAETDSALLGLSVETSWTGDDITGLHAVAVVTLPAATDGLAAYAKSILNHLNILTMFNRKRPLAAAVRAVRLAQYVLADGVTRVEVEGEQITVGAAVNLIDAEGVSLGPAPDGEHVLQDGTALIVEAGVIVEVREPGTEAPEAEAPPAPQAVTVDGVEVTPDMIRELLAGLKAQAPPPAPAAPLRQLAFGPPPASRRRRDPAAEVLDGVRLLQANRRARKDGIRPAGRRRTPATRDFAAIIDPLVGHVEPSYVQELFHAEIGLAGLDRYMTPIDESGKAVGNVDYQITLPNIHSAGRLVPKAGCVYRDDNVIFSGRQMRVAPFEFYRELCIDDLQRLVSAQAYESDTELPMQSLIINYLLAEATRDWWRQIIAGAVAAGDVIDGIYTQALADGMVPQVPFSVTPTTAVAGYQALVRAVRPEVKAAAAARGELLGLLASWGNVEDYMVNLGATQQYLVEGAGPPMRLAPYGFAEMVGTALLGPDAAIIGARQNLFYVVSDSTRMETGLQDAGREKYFWFRFEGHIGAGYAVSNDIAVMHTP